MIPYYIADIKDYLSEDDITLAPEINQKIYETVREYREKRFEDFEYKHFKNLAKSLGAVLPNGSILFPNNQGRN